MKLDNDVYKKVNAIAKNNDGHYSRFAKKFLFKTAEGRDAFVDEAEREVFRQKDEQPIKDEGDKSVQATTAQEQTAPVAKPAETPAAKLDNENASNKPVDVKENVAKFADRIGVDAGLLQDMINRGLTYENINEYGRFDNLLKTLDAEKAKAYIASLTGQEMPQFRVNNRVNAVLKSVIVSGKVPESNKTIVVKGDEFGDYSDISELRGV